MENKNRKAKNYCQSNKEKLQIRFFFFLQHNKLQLDKTKNK